MIPANSIPITISIPMLNNDAKKSQMPLQIKQIMVRVAGQSHATSAEQMIITGTCTCLLNIERRRMDSLRSAKLNQRNALFDVGRSMFDVGRSDPLHTIALSRVGMDTYAAKSFLEVSTNGKSTSVSAM
jgi:hypothetical protein